MKKKLKDLKGTCEYCELKHLCVDSYREPLCQNEKVKDISVKKFLRVAKSLSDENMTKVGDLGGHCGNCPLIEYCMQGRGTPKLCTEEKAKRLSVKSYLEQAKCISEEEIREQIMEYEENGNNSSWTDNRNGAIFDIVKQRLAPPSPEDGYIDNIHEDREK